MGRVRILEVRSCAGTESLEAKLYGSLNENSSDRFVKGKRWSLLLAIIAERNVKKVISSLKFARSETNAILLEESEKATPWWFSI